MKTALLTIGACLLVSGCTSSTNTEVVNTLEEPIYCPVVKVVSLHEVNDLEEHYYTLHSSGNKKYLFDGLVGLNIDAKGYSQRHEQLKLSIEKAYEDRFIIYGQGSSKDLIENYNDSKFTVSYILRSLKTVSHFSANNQYADNEEFKNTVIKVCQLEDELEMVNFLRGVFKDNEQELQKVIFASGDIII